MNILPTLTAFIGRVANALGRNNATLRMPTRTQVIMMEVRRDHTNALATDVGPLESARIEDERIRALLTPDENRARTVKASQAMWTAQRKAELPLAMRAQHLTKIRLLEGTSLNERFSPRPVILTVAEVTEVLARMIETADEMTAQEISWIPVAGLLAGRTVAEVRKGELGQAIKQASGAARGAGTGRPRKVRKGSPLDAFRLYYAHQVLAPGAREVGVDGRVGNLPVKVEGCACAGYGFNGSVTCAGHGFAVRPSQDMRHPLAQGTGGRVDSYRDGVRATVGTTAMTEHCKVPWAVAHGRALMG